MPLYDSVASFSECGLYRWNLRRKISNNKRSIIFIGLNPSKADNCNNDATLRRLIGFSTSWNYGSLVVINLFARIGRSPQILKKVDDPIGFKNDHEILFSGSSWSSDPSCDLWLGWGDRGAWRSRDYHVMQLLKKYFIYRQQQFPYALGPLVIGFTKAGHPRHPLYASSSKDLRPFIWRNSVFA